MGVLGKLILETARGNVKERVLSLEERAKVLAGIRRYFDGPFEFREPRDDNGAPYIYDSKGNAVAMLMWPAHPVEETGDAEQATYALGRLMAAACSEDQTSEKP